MKVYVAAPGQHNWPVIPDDVQDRLIELLNEYLNEDKLGVSLKRVRKRTKDQPSKHPAKQHIAIGLRSVMRCLKQKQCSLVLICSSLMPIILTKPILLLSQIHSIPSIRVRNLSTVLTKIFSIPHCATIAFKNSCEEHDELKQLVDKLLKIINGSEQQESSLTFASGKLVAPYQNPKRVSAGINKKKTKLKPKNK